jgi:hypothetical protein
MERAARSTREALDIAAESMMHVAVETQLLEGDPVPAFLKLLP